jgi:hypothetical protein
MASRRLERDDESDRRYIDDFRAKRIDNRSKSPRVRVRHLPRHSGRCRFSGGSVSALVEAERLLFLDGHVAEWPDKYRERIGNRDGQSRWGRNLDMEDHIEHRSWNGTGVGQLRRGLGIAEFYYYLIE